MRKRLLFLYPKRVHKNCATVLLALVLTACGSGVMKDRGSYVVDRHHSAVAQNERIRFLILHYTALNDSRSLQSLTGNEVSAHYLIPKYPASRRGKPVVWQLVDDHKRSWHAGVSNWDGRVNLNDSSIGIEIVNIGYTQGLLNQRVWSPYPAKQVAAVAAVARDIIARYKIVPENVLAHSDIAPTRKQDPGPLFPWEKLAAMGIGAWPEKKTVNKYLAGRRPGEAADVLEIQQALKRYGYDKIPQDGILDKDTEKTISAFQMHFRPADISGRPDAETEALIKALLEKYRPSAA